jgi:hypothetical protein
MDGLWDGNWTASRHRGDIQYLIVITICIPAVPGKAGFFSERVFGAGSLFGELAQKVYRYPPEIGFEQYITLKPTWTMAFDELNCLNCEI